VNNDNQDDCEVAAKPVVQQEPVFTSKDVPNGRDFHCDVPQGEKRLDGFRLDEVMVLDIFAGTARLSRAMRCGDECNGHDKDSQRAQSVHIAAYDLNESDQVAALSDFISKHSHVILGAHFAPSCGTASRARGRPLPKLAKWASKCRKPCVVKASQWASFWSGQN